MTDTPWQELDGTAWLVESKGRRYAELAEAIQRSTRALQKITDEIDTKSLAMDETRKLAETVRENITKAEERYRATGQALQTYGAALRAAQDEADPAAARLRELRGDLASARTTAHHAGSAVDDLPSTATPEEQLEAQRAQRTADRKVSSLESSISYWEGVWTSGHDAKDRAAGTAISAIDEVVTGRKTHGLEDSGWDQFGEVWDKIYEVVKIVCDVAGILAIFLSWVPFLGQVLLALAAIGAILAVVNAIVNVGRGKGNGWDVLAAAGMAVLTLFGGKAVSLFANYAKARAVVTTTARLAPRAAKVQFGTSVIKSSKTVFGATTGQRVWSVIKSPFTRSATDKKIWGLLTHGEGSKALSTWSGSKFPLPYKDGLRRLLVGNDDALASLDLIMKSSTFVDGGTAAAQSIAMTGAILTNMSTLGRNTVGLASALSGGDLVAAGSSANSLATQPAGGSWGAVTGAPLKVVSWFQ